MKRAALPTMLTLCNGICGFAAIAWASKIGANDPSGLQPAGLFSLCGWLILLAMVFDIFDGYAARLCRCTSRFGGELDSLCDVVSFGVAPAFLLLKLGPGWEQPFLHSLVAGLAAFYLLCTILRLARFNVENVGENTTSKKTFRGLPSPGAAGCLATLAILRGSLPAKLLQLWPESDPEMVRSLVEVWAPAGTLVLALLMVSRVPYPRLSKAWLRNLQRVVPLLQLGVLVCVVILLRELALVAAFWTYALGMPLHYLAVRGRQPAEVNLPSVEESWRR